MLTEIAIQIKSLSFLLGLGGFFSMTKSALIAFMLLPSLSQNTKVSSPLFKKDVNRKKLIILGAGILMVVLFAFAAYLNFWVLADIKPDDLKSGKAVLQPNEAKAIIGIIIIAIAFIAADVFVTIKKQEVSDMVSSA